MCNRLITIQVQMCPLNNDQGWHLYLIFRLLFHSYWPMMKYEFTIPRWQLFQKYHPVACREACLCDNSLLFLCILALWVNKMVLPWLTLNWICNVMPVQHVRTCILQQHLVKIQTSSTATKVYNVSDNSDIEHGTVGKFIGNLFIKLYSTRHSNCFCWMVISASTRQWYLKFSTADSTRQAHCYKLLQLPWHQ